MSPCQLADYSMLEAGLQQDDLNVVDLFAGCGGFGLGLELAGFRPVFVNELNDDARASYIINRRDRHPHFARDLDETRWLNPFSSSDARELANEPEQLDQLEELLNKEFGIAHGNLDLVVGGPPCQGFSGIGHRRSYAVDKAGLPSNHLYKDMAKIIQRLRPRAFVFENVRGLLTGRWTAEGQRGEIWRDIKRAFIDIREYVIGAELVYAKHFGVPQNRPRILLVGIRHDVAGQPATLLDEIDQIDGTGIANGFLPSSGTQPPHLEDLLGDLIDPWHQNGESTPHYPSSVENEVQRWFRTCWVEGKVSRKGSPVSEHEYSKHAPKVITRFKAMQRNKPYEGTKKFAQRVLPRKWGPRGPTITATSLPDDYVHFEQPRTLTVREWARLQGFPDWYQFHGKRTTGGLRRAGNPIDGIHCRDLPKYTQIGNAVPVSMAQAIGEHLATILRSGRLET